MRFNNKLKFVEKFSPSWFASVMGTGVLALTTFLFSKYYNFLTPLSFLLFYFNMLLFIVLFIPWILRWILFTKKAMADLNDPIQTNFYPTIAIALLILSADILIIGSNKDMSFFVWFLGAVLTIFFGLFIPYLMFKSKEVQIHHINPAWYIPPAGLVVIPIAGSFFIPMFSGLAQQIIILINVFGLGAGFFLYLTLLAVCVYRFILHEPLPNVLAPTLWISLGPIGASIVSLINLSNNVSFLQPKSVFFTLGFFTWGFGLWWFLLVIAMTLHYIRRLKLPYALSWWAFIFPLGAFVSSSISLSKALNISLIHTIGFLLYLLLLSLWSITIFKTTKTFILPLFRDK